MSRQVYHAHQWDLIPEDAFYLRSTMKEQLALYGVKQGGTKYRLGMAVEARWETYKYPIWSRMATNHPTISISYQGSNVGDISAIPDINIEKQINVAVPMFRFIGANMLNQNGEDKFAGTYISGDGRRLFARGVLQEETSGVRYTNAATGAIEEVAPTSTRRTWREEVHLKYGEENMYMGLANGTPLGTIVPLNQIDVDRLCPIWDNTKVADDGTTGDFVSAKMSEATAFSSTDMSLRTLKPSEQIIGLSMAAIPVNMFFRDILDYTQAPVPDLRYFDHWTLPVWHGTLPFLAGRVDNTGTASYLIAAGDILPGGIVYNALMRTRSYSYLAFPYDNDNNKYPYKDTMVGVGPFGEIQVGTDSYLPVSTNGAKNMNKVNTALSPLNVPVGDTPTVYTQFVPASFTVKEAIMTNVVTGKCGSAEVTAINATQVTVAAGGASTAVGNGEVSVCLKLSSKRIVGKLDAVMPAIRNTKSAAMNTAINQTQGLDKVVNTLSQYVYDVYKEHKRVITVTIGGVVKTIDFAAGTSTSGTPAVTSNYTPDHFMLDIAKQGLIGSALVRIDVFKNINVVK